jgi:eukaryotic-like serine/threonine-protein kinase
VPLIKSFAEIQRGNTTNAMDLLNTASVYARANSSVQYARGLAYLRSKQGVEAAQEFQKIPDLKGFYGVDLLIPVAHLGLARAYALQGDSARSRIAYQDFFAMWKNADPDLPLLKQARGEYATVK